MSAASGSNADFDGAFLYAQKSRFVCGELEHNRRVTRGVFVGSGFVATGFVGVADSDGSDDLPVDVNDENYDVAGRRRRNVGADGSDDEHDANLHADFYLRDGAQYAVGACSVLVHRKSFHSGANVDIEKHA